MSRTKSGIKYYFNVSNLWPRLIVLKILLVLIIKSIQLTNDRYEILNPAAQLDVLKSILDSIYNFSYYYPEPIYSRAFDTASAAP